MVFSRDTLFRVVCNIRTPIASGNETVGTGMFVNKGNKVFLLTASHVAHSVNSDTHIIMSDSSSNPQSIPIYTFSNLGNWVDHPIADISYLEMAINQTNIGLVQNRCFPYEQISLSATPPSRDTELTCIGFPLGLGALGKYSPLTFRTFASSSLITYRRADTRQLSDFFVLENPSVGGYSGGPVFDLGYIISGMIHQQNENTICYGLMHGTLLDETGGKMALVTPTSYLHGWL